MATDNIHSIGVVNLVYGPTFPLPLRIVRSGLHLVTYLDVDNFYDKNTETTLHEICVQDFSDSIKPILSVSLIYELAWLAVTGKSEKKLGQIFI